MKSAGRILAVITDSAQGCHVLDKVAALAGAHESAVHVVRVIYEDLVEFPGFKADAAQALKVFLMQSEEEILVDLAEDYRDKFSDLEAHVLWNQRVSEGAIHAAENFEADLIVKAVGTGEVHLPRHPDDWNLLRHAERPVMLVGPNQWDDKPVVLVASDLLDDIHADLNAKIVSRADELADALNGSLRVVCAYPGISSWATAEAKIGLDYGRLVDDIETIAQRNVANLLNSSISRTDMILSEGKPVDVIRAAAEANHSSIVVVGTSAREGVRGLVLGNTSEALLSALECDLLVVPQ